MNLNNQKGSLRMLSDFKYSSFYKALRACIFSIK
jgi:hypothetical protein